MIKEVRSHPEEFPCGTICTVELPVQWGRISQICIFAACPRCASFNVDILFDAPPPPPPTKQRRERTKFKVLWRTSRDAKMVLFCVNFLSVHAWKVSSHCTLRTIWNNSFVTNNVNLCFEVSHFVVAVGVSIGLLQLTITWHKICHAGGQGHYYFRTGTLKQRNLNQWSLTCLCFDVPVRE